MRVAFLSLLLLSLNLACVTHFDVDAGGNANVDGGSAADVPSSVDANNNIDAGHSNHDAALSDHSSTTDLGSQTDHTQTDSAAGTDLGNNPSDANMQDSSSQSDSAVDVPDGGMPLGAHCENAPCGDGMMCIGNNTEAYCRLTCDLNGSDCNPNSEYCISINLADGGTAATGACVPAGGENAPCDDEPCAGLYFCAYMGNDAAASTCRVVCDPNAAEGSDAGCPSQQNCYGINGYDGGACL